jgi:phosphoribosyl-ATP pyrophosphohydrolase/phosphoribosyl-AMP cyclohydrolase/histidinol dehydrogenase
MLSAAGICGVDGFLAAGGAHAIAALTHGVGGMPAADVVVGPGNRWVTAAKQIVSGHVKIDMLAGPSELVVLADETANPVIVAADLLAQAEHDADARPILVTTSKELLTEVEKELREQLDNLPTAETARAALVNGFAILAQDLDSGVAVCERIAPEHLELQINGAKQVAERISKCGAVFIGNRTGEVIGDYGAGPNHVLPTGGTARHASGLSVATFLRSQTWLEVNDDTSSAELIDDAIELANLEGLVAHARSAVIRKTMIVAGD